MEQHAEEVETLNFGSSHSWFGINPTYINGIAFNLAFPSQSLKYDCFLLYKWEHRYKNLKTVIVPISYFTFFFENPCGLPQAPSCYKNYMNCPYYPCLSVYSFEVLFFKALHGKLITQHDNNWNVLSDDNGWHDTPVEPKAKDWDDLVKAKSLVKVQTGSKDNVELNYSYLKDIASFCQKNNIRLVLVTIPTSKVYNQLTNGELIQITDSVIRRFQEEMSVVFYNYREDYRFSFDDFADINHLNPSGAEKFTKILMRDIKSIPQ